MSLSEELERLQELRQSGGITAEEFAKAKARLLDEPPPSSTGGSGGGFPGMTGNGDPEQVQRVARLWGMILHLSLLCGLAVPVLGLIVPVILWQLKKDDLPDVDAHGRNAVNWIISLVIYLIACVPLAFVFIGIPLAFVLSALSIIFPIIAAVQANNGEVWEYPLAIRFLR